MTRRTFVYKHDNSRKFWSVDIRGTKLTTRWGRLDTTGQEKAQVFSSTAETKRAAEKLIQAKLRKGYSELTEGAPRPSTRKRTTNIPLQRTDEHRISPKNKRPAPSVHQSYREQFETLIRDMEANPRIKLKETKLSGPTTASTLRDAARLAGGRLPKELIDLYREMNGICIKWEIVDKHIRAGNSLLDTGEVHLLPLVGGEESVFSSWKGWVWFDYSHEELKRIKPVDFFGESAVSIYPVPGTAELYYHTILTSSSYPLGCNFEEYLFLLFKSRGLHGWQSMLCADLQRSPEANQFRQVMPILFSDYDANDFKLRTKRKRTRFLKSRT